MIILGITHKVVLKLIEEHKLQSQKTTIQYPGRQLSVLNKTKNENEDQIVNEKYFNCPLCPLTVSDGMRKDHLVKHFYAQLSSTIEASIDGPHECHLCRHVSISRNRLIKHIGAFHGLVEKYLRDYLPDCDRLKISTKSEEELRTLATPSITEHTGGSVECRLCEKPQFFK